MMTSISIPANMSDEETQPLSQALDNAPHLSSSGLTRMLLAMCMVPIVTIATLFWYMPPVHEGELEAGIAAEGLPVASFYEPYLDEREEISGDAVLILTNESDQDWTHLNIQINKHYQIYEHEPIPAGESRRFRLDRFVSRTGAKFNLRYNPLKFVRVYARRPTKDRATFATDFDWEAVQ
ncbi:MAG: hypothetical protein AAGA30_02705 [Planctomycetota bacterium]